MDLLVTAGNTQTPLDKVRCITNIFTGRTGAGIAVEAARRGHAVTLLTSQPETAAADSRLRVIPYRTFDDLADLLQSRLGTEAPDAIVHSAAVSDFCPAGVFAPEAGLAFDEATGSIHGRMLDRAAGKIQSDAAELWIRLVPTPKLVDRFRAAWGFGGILVKFKLEVDMTRDRLREIAERSRLHSDADLMVANTLEGAAEWALIGPIDGGYREIARRDLAIAVVDRIETLALGSDECRMTKE